MKKVIIQATTNDNKIHTFVYCKVAITILTQLKDHYKDIKVLETKNGIIFTPSTKKVF